MPKSTSFIVRNATWGGASAAVRALAGLCISLLALRLLGGARYGYLVTLLSLFALYLALNSSVFTVLVSSLMAMPRGERDKNCVLVSVANLFTLLSIATLVVLSTAIWVMAPKILSFRIVEVDLLEEIRLSVIAMGVLTSLQIITALKSAIIESFGRLDLAMKWQLFGPILVLSLLAFLYIFLIPTSALGYMAVFVAGAFVDLCLIVNVSGRLIPRSPLFKLSRQDMIQVWSLMKSGATLQASSLMSLFLEPLNKLLLNHYAGVLSVTAYDLAMKFIWGIQSLFIAAMRVFLHMSGEEGSVVGRIFSRVLSLVLVPVLAAHVVAAIFLSWTIHQWTMIGDPRQIMIFFGIATLSNLAMIYVSPLYISLIGRSDLRFILRSQAVLAITNVTISLILIPFFHLLGAAFGLFFATAFNVVLIYRRHEDWVGQSGLAPLSMSGQAWRYFFVMLLFVFAIVLGGASTLNYAAEVTILFFIAFISWNEPLYRMLSTRIIGRK